MTCCRCRMGFTLIELLVVVGIIGVMSAVLYGVITNRQQEAYRVTCLSNLRQCGVAFRVYMNDWDAQIPPRYEVAKHLLPANITQCRMDHWRRLDWPMIGSYLYPRGVRGWDECTDEQMIKRLPSDIYGDCPYWMVDVFHTRNGRMPIPEQPDPVTGRLPHPNKDGEQWPDDLPSPLLVLLLDGHVRPLKVYDDISWMALHPNGTKIPMPTYDFCWSGLVGLPYMLKAGSGCTEKDETFPR